MRYPKVLYVAAIKLILITSVALLMATMVACDTGQSGQKSALKKSIANTAQQSIDNQAEREDAYLAEIKPVTNKFLATKEFYNSEIMRLGEKAQDTTSIQEYAEVLEDLVEMLEPTAAKFLKYSEDLRSIRPAPRFEEFHFLFVGAMSDMHGAA